MKLAIAVLLLSSGCPPDLSRDEFRFDYYFQANCGIYFFSQCPMDQQSVNDSIFVALQAFSHNNLPYSAMCASFNNLVVYYFPTRLLPAQYCTQVPSGSCDGLSSFEGVYVAHAGAPLAHELLHVWDWQNLGVFSSQHWGWDTNGYDDASTEYVMNFTEFWETCP